MGQLVLSLFTGIGLLDEAFRRAGFCVVSAGDIITGQDIRNFTSIAGRFDGVIGSSPCEDFGTYKTNKSGYSLEMIEEFKRVVLESKPKWWLHESIKGVPNIKIEGFNHQRTLINQAWYEKMYRVGIIQFGCKTNQHIQIPRGNVKDKKVVFMNDSRSLSELKHLKGLPDSFDLPNINIAGKKKLIGNTVPLKMGKVIAEAVRDTVYNQKIINQHSDNWSDVFLEKNTSVKYCKCGCGMKMFGRKSYYNGTCRKTAQRNRNKIFTQHTSTTSTQDQQCVNP